MKDLDLNQNNKIEKDFISNNDKIVFGHLKRKLNTNYPLVVIQFLR